MGNHPRTSKPPIKKGELKKAMFGHPSELFERSDDMRHSLHRPCQMRVLPQKVKDSLEKEASSSKSPPKGGRFRGAAVIMEADDRRALDNGVPFGAP